jgi:hypothetical protein
VVVSDAEEGLSGGQSTFNSIQPPDDRGDALEQELDQILSDALDHVRDVRVAVRRDKLSNLDSQGQPLVGDAPRL